MGCTPDRGKEEGNASIAAFANIPSVAGNCEQDDPFEKVDCLLMGYISDYPGWSKEHERRVSVLLGSPFADVNRRSSFRCKNTNWGSERLPYLSCALTANPKAIEVLVENKADFSVRGSSGTYGGFFLYEDYILPDRWGTPNTPSELFEPLESLLLLHGLDPNEIGFPRSPERGVPLHFAFLRSCALDDPLFDSRFAHWVRMVEAGVYDLSVRAGSGATALEFLQRQIDRGPRTNWSNIDRCRRMAQTIRGRTPMPP
jgi:hypothetical protein